MNSPLAGLETLEPPARKERALADAFLDWAAALDELGLARARQELAKLHALPPGWVKLVKARRAKRIVESTDPAEWRRQLRAAEESGRPLASPFNLRLICEHWEPLKTLRLNELTLRAELNGEPLKSGDTHEWAANIEQEFGMPVPLTNLDAAFEAAAESRAYHPGQEYLNGLAWDGKQRIPYIARDILDNHDPLSWRMVECFLVASVARTYNRGEVAQKQGIQADTMLTLFSAKQGRKKTSFFRVLFDGSVYIGDINPGEPDCMMAMNGVRCVVIDEVDEFVNKVEWPRIKRVIGQTAFDYRAPYARRGAHHLARHVWGATTNRDDILRDETGSRRWHIISVGPAGVEDRMERLAAERDQIWAEAKQIFEDGVDEAGVPRRYLWWLTPEEERAREAGAMAFEDFGILDEKISSWVASKSGEFRMADLLKYGLEIPDEKIGDSPAREKKIGGILVRLGWESYRPRDEDGKQRRVWRRKTEEDRG